MIPLLHDFSDARVLVFGGGPVGARKARRFDSEATVLVVSPEFADAGFGDATLIRAAPEPDAVDGWLDRVAPALAVAATDDEAVNGAIVEAARNRGILVNRADRAGGRRPGSVVVPATVREGPVVVSISTGGGAPALSKYLREDLEERLDGTAEMAELLSELRRDLKARGVDPVRRQEIITRVVNDPDIWTALRTGTPNIHRVIDEVRSGELPEDDSP